MYITQHLSIRAIVKHYCATRPELYPVLCFKTVRQWLDKYGIPLHEIHPLMPAYTELYELYIIHKFSVRAIVKYYLTTQPEQYPTLISKTVRRWLKKNNIPLRKKSSPIPSYSELYELYISQNLAITEITQHYKTTQPEIYRTLGETTVTGWIDRYKIPHHEIIPPIPSYAELYELYINRNFSRMEIVKYYQTTQPELYPTLGKTTVYHWLKKYEIQPHEVSLATPAYQEIYDLYITRNLTINEITNYFLTTRPEIYPTLGISTVRRWLLAFKIPMRSSDIPVNSVWREWEELFYKIVPYVLSDINWKSGHTGNEIYVKDSEESIIRPEVVVLDSLGNIEKIIDAKESDGAVSYKDIYIYPFATQKKLVEFWVLDGDSRVEINYSDNSICRILLDNFDENDFIAKEDITSILVYINADDLINRLTIEEIKQDFKQQIVDLRTKRKKSYPNTDSGALNDLLKFI